MPRDPVAAKILVVAVSALAVAALSRLARRAPVREDGWRRLEPSPMHWTALVGSGVLFLFILYVALFMGSSRHDAERQVRIALWILLAIGIGIALAAWAIHRVRSLGFEWREGALAWRNGQGGRRVRGIDELASVHPSVWGWVLLRFTDGESVKLDAYAQGCAELIERLAQQRPDLLPPPSPGP